MNTAKVIERLSEGLVAARTSYGDQLWARRKLRKSAQCWSCGKALAVGDAAFGTMNASTMNRHHRICGGCLR